MDQMHFFGKGILLVEICIFLVILIVIRILFLIYNIVTGHSKMYQGIRKNSAKTIICIGSGGHTTEILALTDTIDFMTYTPRYYIMANSDTTSFAKVKQLENSKCKDRSNKDYFIKEIPRSRYVNQSYISSIFTTIYSIICCIPLVCKVRPDLILCNGPGTCVPICIIAFLLKAVFICDTKIVFVESFCRTKTFSLSGKILMYLADNILVQWPSLKRKLKRSDYIGQLL